jgi:Ca2+-transporting ATPase
MPIFRRKLIVKHEVPDMRWHALSGEEVMSAAGASIEGLTDERVRDSVSRFGLNILPENAGEGPVRIFFRQMNSPIIAVLACSAVLAFVLDPSGGIKNAAVISSVILLNALIGFFQEFRANRAIAALSAMVPQSASVLRNGMRMSIGAADVALGDIVFLSSGDRVPADIRLLQVNSLRTDESALTGESTPVDKTVDPVIPDAGLGDRTCVAFSGTFVVFGSGMGVAVRIGGDTELGRISGMLRSVESVETPLSKTLGRVGKGLSLLVAVLSVVILSIGIWREMAHGAQFLEALRSSVMFAIALAVGAIPEGLPAMVTVILAFGVLRMARRRAVIRYLPAVETLGSTTVICSDKTGTLTRNRMTLRDVWIPDASITRAELLRAAVLCSDAAIEKKGEGYVVHGDPTEGALVEGAFLEGFDTDAWRESSPRRGLIPFESDYQYMAVSAGGDIFVKGSPEAVTARCSGMPAAEREEIERKIHESAEQGMRVLALAKRTGDIERLDHEHVAGGLSFMGLVAMIDPPRPEAVAAVADAQRAGIVVKMITGDHRKTAASIGREIGLGGGEAVDGSELSAMDDAAFAASAASANVFARVAPEHKLRLVRALQRQGHVVAMTGDGVNDAPALKQADIGVAMGITGTSVSKEAADVVLLDDNFATIRSAVEEGRRIYDNLVKSLSFLLPTNLCFAFLFAFAVAFFPFHPATSELIVPLSPLQLFWINLVASLLLGTPLAFEPAEPDVMNRPPRPASAPILGRALALRTAVIGAVMAACCIVVFLTEYAAMTGNGIAEQTAMAKAQTMALNTVVMLQLWYLLESRSLRLTLFELNPLSNRALLAGVGILLALQVAMTHLPVMNAVFETAPLSPQEWLKTVLFGFAVVPLTVAEKIFTRFVMKKDTAE